MKKFKIPVEWTVYDSIEVVADSLEEAIDIVRDNESIIPLGLDPEYIDSSYKIDDGNNGESNTSEAARFIRTYYDEYEDEASDDEKEQGKGVYVNYDFIKAEELD